MPSDDLDLNKNLILLINDESESLFNLQTDLTFSNYHIDQSFSAEEILEKTSVNKYCLIIVNSKIKSINVFELLNILHNHPTTSEIPIIFHNSIDFYRKIFKNPNGFKSKEVIVKPFDSLFLRLKAETFLKQFIRQDTLTITNNKLIRKNNTVTGVINKYKNSVYDSSQNDHFSLQSSILNSLPANICLIDHDGTIITVNQTWKKFGKEHGYKYDSFGLGLNYFTICDKAFKDGLIEVLNVSDGIKSVLSNEKVFFEFEYQLIKDFWYKIFVTPLLFEKNITGAIITHIDISHQKKMEFDLRKSEEYFKSLASNTPNIIMEVNRDLEITYMNNSNNDVIIQNFIGKKVFELASSESHEMIKKSIDNVFKNHKKERYETKITTESGEELWYITVAGPVIINGEVNSVILLSEDITRQKKWKII